MNKLSQKQRLLKLFRDNGNMLTLGQIMQTDLAAEYRARISELRGDGYDIPDPAINRQEPSKNLYILIESDRQILPTPEKPQEAPQSTQSKNNTTVQDRGTFRGRYKLSQGDRGELIKQYRETQSTYPESHIQYKKISEQVERLKCKC